MDWKPAWKEFPLGSGYYLCRIDDHYGIFKFDAGRFHPNEWNEYTGVNKEGCYHGNEHCIIHWMELPDFHPLTFEDVREIKKLRIEREKLLKKERRVEKECSGNRVVGGKR